MKKYFTKNKIIAGVVGLMAIVSVVNTQAIIKLSLRGVSGTDQSAQVFQTNKTCIEVLPPSDNRTSFIDGNGNISNQTHDYHVGFKIKNRCTYPIAVIVDYTNISLVSNNAVNLVKVQNFSDLSSIPNLVGQFAGPYSVNPGVPIWGEPAQVNIPVPGSNTMISASVIPASGQKDFFVQGQLSLNGTAWQGLFTRVSLDKFRWFRFSDFSSDNNLSNSEIKTFTFLPNTFVSSYARFNSSGDDCVPGTIIGYDKNGNPIYCDGDNGGADCVPGTLIGFDSNGNPIYCDGDGDNGGTDCVPGTLIGFNKDGSPIYCK